MLLYVRSSLKHEFNNPRLEMKIRLITFYLTQYIWHKYNVPLYITSIERSEGVHSLGRGLDCDNDRLSPSEKKAVAEHINGLFTYDPFRPGFKVCFLHVADPADYAGLDTGGDHFHIQVHDNTILNSDLVWN